MKIIKLFLTIQLLLNTINCSTSTKLDSNQHTGYDLISLKIETAKTDYKKKKKFLLKIPPKKNNVEKMMGLHSYQQEYRIKYPFGAIIYISNNYIDGGELNFANRVYSNIGGYNKDHVFDTIKVDGNQKNGLFWKEYILGDICIGYIDVPQEMKLVFDKSINSLKMKK